MWEGNRYFPAEGEVFTTPAGNEYVIGSGKSRNSRFAARDGKRFFIKAVPRESLLFQYRELSMLHRLAQVPVASIQPLEDFERDGNGYIVFPAADSEDMTTHWEKRKPLSLYDVDAFVRGAGATLHALHAAGFTHGDVKPDNVFRDWTWFDFQLGQGPGDEPVTSKRRGFFLGTVGFLPYEITSTQMYDKDAQVDVYGFGASAYLLLTDKHPYQDSPSSFDMFERMGREPPTDVRELRSDVPEKLAQVVMRSLAISRDFRYPSIEALLDDYSSVKIEVPAYQMSLFSPAHFA